MSKLSQRSRLKLEGVHPDLCAVVEKAAEYGPDFIVTEGLRTLERQKALRKLGKSETLASRHLTGHAVDLADVKAKYQKADMVAISASMKRAAAELNIPIVWGGDWHSKRYGAGWDTPHFELDRKHYPAGRTHIRWKDRIIDAAQVVGSARAVGGVAVGGVTVAASENPEAVTEAVQTIPAPPTGWLEGLTNLGIWQTMGEQLWALKDFAFGQPILAGGLGISLLLVWLWPAKKSQPDEPVEVG
jgi:peptidoglycan LD-endopeptidase CwlK